jgi:lysophospholipase L1-like esterase
MMSLMKKKIFYISLATNAGLAFILFVSYYWLKNSVQTQTINAQKSHQERRKELFEVLPKKHREIIMLGDALIEEGNWSELLKNPKVRNRGVRGDKTIDILKRLRDITEAQPTQIYLYVGSEDLAINRNPVEIMQDYEKILTEIKLNAPGTQVWVQSLLPVNFVKGERLRDNTSIQKLNQKLEALCARFGAKYLNLYATFLLNEQLNDQYTNDGLHLNAKGYQLWAKTITQMLPNKGILMN